ncbi:peptidoglycan D,D-transpeptidase FtsI family protein [Novosphingobium ginsenosidimutans]|uniref:Penicillin-binding protein 2 n=1 Tax=Novosphingobium ginsenosidimutans TaxID=1176536 RepID=A0A5B8RZT5_9SPHN|nr:penicillin-binding protein 2 [Novosphingobium ginsenosidimutans]QEA14890.1 penicillin-binding protein 2 [Novosphingobium ginsenosidimutans]
MNTLAVSSIVASGRVEIANTRRQALTMAKARIVVVALGFAALALIAVMRVLYLGLVEGTPANAAGFGMTPQRGDIVDRNGAPLARAFPAYALWYNPAALGDDGAPLVRPVNEVAAALNRIFPDMDVAETAARLASGRPGYLRRRILPEDANKIHALGEPALEFPRETERFYPQGSLAAHVLGFVGADGRGHVGMEGVFDKYLTDPATRGTPAMLSLDSRVQGALEDELLKGIADTNAKGAAGLVLDVETGEVLALASLPSFNPNLIDNASAGNIFNRVTNQVYELGSTFKPITVAAAIDAGTVTDLSRRYQSGRPLEIGGFRIRDSHQFGASLNVPEALIHSSNIVTAQIADELGGPRLNATMRSLGMNERPYIELPARGFPLWPKGEWARITTMTVSYGHGIAVTPLHLATAYAALVNGGIWRPATLKKLAPGEVPQGHRVFKASTSARMRQLLRMIVVDGTGKKADAAGYRVGGKTGSAEKPGVGGYRRSSLVSTFAAAFPMDRPRYVIIAMLDEPQGTAATSGQRTAGWNAAPIVGRVVPRIGPLLGIMPDPTRDVDISDLSPLVGNGDGE